MMQMMFKRFFPKKKPEATFHLEENIELVDIQRLVTNEKKYQQFRAEKIEENFAKRSEDILDTVFNKTVILEQKLRELQESQERKLKALEAPLEKLKSQYENLEISEAAYKTEHVGVLKSVNEQKNVLKAQQKELLAQKNAKMEQIIESEKSKGRKRSANLQGKKDKALSEIKNDLKTNLELLSTRFKANEGALKAAKAEALKSFEKENETIKKQFADLDKKLATRKIALKDYLSKTKTTKEAYKSNIKTTHKTYKGALKPLTNAARVINVRKLKEPERLKEQAKKFGRGVFESKLVLFFVLYAFIVGAGTVSPNSLGLFSPGNWANSIILSNVFIGFLALGETFPILLGGIDLSVGSMMGFTAVVYMVFTAQMMMNPILALFLALVAGGGLGFAQGFIISRFKLPPFIVTLAGLLTLRGAVTIITGGVPITVIGNSDFVISFLSERTGGINGISNISIIFFAVAVVMILFVKVTKFGRYVYATGDNEDAARLSGIRTKNIIAFSYMISGLMAALAALAFLANVRSVAPLSGNANELDAITAVVLGGTALTGGKGGLFKTLIGWFSLSLAVNAFSFQGLNFNVQLVVKGSVIVIAVILDRRYEVFKFARKIYYQYLYRL